MFILARLFLKKNFVAMNEIDTQLILENFKKSSQIKKNLSIFCYILIGLAIGFYVSNFFEKNHKITIINNSKNNSKNIKAEKIMTNPRMSIMHDDGKIYKISATRAYHFTEDEVTMEEVHASSDIGNISAGELKIIDGGNHLIFSKNPVLIFNQ